MIRATLVYLFVALYVAVMGPAGITWSLLTRDTHILYNLARFCVRIAGWMSGVRVLVRGREKLAPGQNYVFLSNHQGNFDGPVLFHSIPRDVRALVKKEMMRLPVLSLVMKRVEFVPLDRQDPVRARAGIDHGAELLRKGYSFIAFPEGTRSRDGRLGEFKKGVFIMAIKAQVPVMPITILNSSRVQSPGEYPIRPGLIELIFHDPVSTEGLDLPDRDHLMSLVRTAIDSALPAETGTGYDIAVSLDPCI
jgi:1-acyl-sn-glycerol-3-phosphate acyltransferase